MLRCKVLAGHDRYGAIVLSVGRLWTES